MDASKAPPMAALVPSANRWVTGRHANASTVRIPTSNAPCTAQIAATEVTSVISGFAMPASWT
jgi:hypothetical protein